MSLLNFFILLLIAVTATHSFKCYRCASPYPINNWGRFKLPAFRGSEQQSDPTCENAHEVNSYVDCTGLCLTINFTMPEFNHTLGIVRECHRLPSDEKELRTQTPCFTEEGTTRQTRKR
ncbi:unnamed protein product [Auanema sp. JU1783]|nr:unnamed protein product [Auanema sp. JU1783]